MWTTAPSEGRVSVPSIFNPLGLACFALFVSAITYLPCAAADTRSVTVSVARRDLRPLGLVTVQLTGAANLQGVTDGSGRISFPGLPTAGAITVTPSRSGFRFEPTQLTIPASPNPASV